MKWHFGLLATAALAGTALAQQFDNASLNGKYYFVHLQVTAAGGQATEGRSLSGSMTFNGTGGFSYTGRLGVGAGAPAAASASGSYTVASAGSVSLSHPQRSNLQLRAWLSGDRNVIVGATTEASDNINDLFVASKAPTVNVTNSVLNGAYTGGTLAFPNGSSAGIRSALVNLTANGSGGFTRANVAGHAADQAGRNVAQDATGATYAINADGTGTANLGAAASLFSGARDIFVSQDGNYILGMSTAAGGRDLFVATKNFSASATTAAFNGRYWIAELTVERPSSFSPDLSFSAGSGAFSALGNGRVLLAERLHLDTRIIDFSGINAYSVNPDSSGALTPLPIQGLSNMALGVPITVGGSSRPNTLVGAQVGTVGSITGQYGVYFAVLAPSFTGTGVFLDPAGVVNAASFAPTPHPISPGAIVSLFGSGLSSTTAQAQSLPLQTSLGGVTVNVNGRAAVFFSVAPGQVNIQVPFEVSGNTATLELRNASGSSQVTVPVLSPTSPGIFSYNDTQSAPGAQSPYRGIILHSDGVTFVTPANPAHPGETVVIYLTGLGALNPPVATGAANPATLPLATAVDTLIRVLIGGEVATSAPFIGGAPFFAGLNQINVVVPLTVIGGPNVPVAISTGNAFTDLVDIAIGN